MSQRNFVATLALAAAVAVGANAGASADIICSQSSFSAQAQQFQQGYSGKPAKKINSGTSTVTNTRVTVSETCFDSETSEIVGTGSRTTRLERYTDGPGNSPFQKRNPISSSCEATGTLSCP